jgi:hypothetical protein
MAVAHGANCAARIRRDLRDSPAASDVGPATMATDRNSTQLTHVPSSSSRAIRSPETGDTAIRRQEAGWVCLALDRGLGSSSI